MGRIDGENEGKNVGIYVGCFDGVNVGRLLGVSVLGENEGVNDGLLEGVKLGFTDGDAVVGTKVASDGVNDGVVVGSCAFTRVTIKSTSSIQYIHEYMVQAPIFFISITYVCT